jgi:hypothetical protein
VSSTRSPFQAFRSGTVQLVVVDRQKDGTHITSIMNFHDGGPEIVITQSGKVDTTISAGFNLENVTLKMAGQSSLVLGFDHYEPKQFEFVGNANSFIAQKLLVGKYLDNHGRAFEFTRDGHANFPDRHFTYLIGLDHVINKFDYFIDQDTKAIYGYRIDNDKLYVYRTEGALGQKESHAPEMILTRCKKCEQ